MNWSPVLVDTEVVSFLAKDHPFGTAYKKFLEGRLLAISIVTLGEVEYGMLSNHWGEKRREKMRHFLERFTPIPADEDIARTWAQIRTECAAKGRPIGFADAWIAATAIQLSIPLVSHNVKDYAAISALTIITH